MPAASSYTVSREPHLREVKRTGADLDFEKIYLEYSAFILLVLRRLGVRHDDVEDACQEVFLVVHRRLDSFEGRSSVKTWLYAIAVRVASDHRRKKVHARSDVAVETIPQEPKQLDTVSEREARSIVYQILDGLEENERAVFVGYELEGLCMIEVAEAMNSPLQTAYSRLHAARRYFEASIARLRAKEKHR